MPLIRFISPVDSMWRSTVKVIEARLVEDTLIRRYEAERTHVDGIPGGEVASLRAHFGTSNTFSACRELEKPQLLFEKLLGYANHLGLYSEIGPSGQHFGSFPQACKAPRADQYRNIRFKRLILRPGCKDRGKIPRLE